MGMAVLYSAGCFVTLRREGPVAIGPKSCQGCCTAPSLLETVGAETQSSMAWHCITERKQPACSIVLRLSLGRAQRERETPTASASEDLPAQEYHRAGALIVLLQRRAGLSFLRDWRRLISGSPLMGLGNWMHVITLCYYLLLSVYYIRHIQKAVYSLSLFAELAPGLLEGHGVGPVSQDHLGGAEWIRTEPKGFLVLLLL